MKLHIVTVALRDGEDLADTYRSCQFQPGLPFGTAHFIFAKNAGAGLDAKYPNSSVLKSEDSGIYSAMNLAFEHLTTALDDEDVVIFLNAGDRLDQTELAKHLERHVEQSADVSVASVNLMRNGVIVGRVPAPKATSSLGEIIYRAYPCHQSTFYSARFLKGVQERRGRVYLEEFRVCADLELYLRAQEFVVVTTNFSTSAYDVEGFSSRQAVLVAAEKARLTKLFCPRSRWRIYSGLWSIKARLVAPKRQLLSMLRGSP